MKSNKIKTQLTAHKPLLSHFLIFLFVFLAMKLSHSPLSAVYSLSRLHAATGLSSLDSIEAFLEMKEH